MAQITAQMVSELRKQTGCGMMDCKKALVEADGNFDEAVKVLREKGQAASEKKQSRIAAEGLVDILVSGKKVSGTAQRILGKRILYHGTLLFDSDLDMVAGALRADPSKFQSKSIQSVRSRVGNIRDFLKEDMDLPTFWTHLKAALLHDHATPGALSAEDLSAVKELQQSKYNSWDWNFGRSPKYAFSNKQKWPGGILEVRLAVESGHIADIAFYGDFLSTLPLDAVEGALKGCRLHPDDVKAVLDRFPMSHHFGGITRDEVLETIFRAFR